MHKHGDDEVAEVEVSGHDTFLPIPFCYARRLEVLVCDEKKICGSRKISGWEAEME